MSAAKAFPLLNIRDFRVRQKSAFRLKELGLLSSNDSLTSPGWEYLARIIDAHTLQMASEQSLAHLSEVSAEYERAARWGRLETYLSEPFKEPEPRYVKMDAPSHVVSFCTECLRSAQLSICVGTWAGAIAYCSLAVEHVLASVLIAKGLRKPFTELPALEILNGDFGKQVPQVSGLTRRLVSLIANFRNDSVHPRGTDLKPGEMQARNVYDLATRFLTEVRTSWFDVSDGFSESQA
jgi:hypothetical protein